VLDAVDMVALVSSRTELRRRGVNSYFGLCPFHDERTPSFHVSPDEKLYHCFGCQASGDAFTFLMETEGLDFTGALEALAKRFGVRLQTENEDPKAAARRRTRERLYTLLDRAAAYYARYLWEAREASGAREYLLGRGLSEQILREFRVGYAPSAWDRMLMASRSAGFTEGELIAAGLAQRSRSAPGRIYDRFRERIMFPCADLRGRVVGFGARAMRDNQPPKYLNTAEGELYHKREIVYGLQVARPQAARAGEVVLVEGYTDVLALHGAGLRNAVGIMGTSLTEEQIGQLQKIAPVLVLCLDADAAGQEAMVRAAGLVRKRELELRVVALPAGRDPAELVAAEGGEALRERVKGAVPFGSFQVERILSGADIRSAEGRDRAIQELKPVFEELPPGLLRDGLMQRVAGLLGLSEGQLGALFARSVREPLTRRGGGETRPRQVVDPDVRKERDFLVLCVALPSAGEQALERIDLDEHLTSVRLRRAARFLVGRLDLPMTGLPPDDEELARVIADLVERAGRVAVVRPEHIEQQRLVLELGRLERAIRRARVTDRRAGGVVGGDRATAAAGGKGVGASLEDAGVVVEQAVAVTEGGAAEGGAGAVPKHALAATEGDAGAVPKRVLAATEGDAGATVHRLALEREKVRAAIQELDVRLERPV
jgi:DNA primase